MRKFKDFVETDMDNVFLNEDEFAETVVFEGVEIKVVKTKDKAVLENGSSVIMDKISCKTSDLPCAVNEDDIVDVDGIMYFVANVEESMGITDLSLRRNG